MRFQQVQLLLKRRCHLLAAHTHRIIARDPLNSRNDIQIFQNTHLHLLLGCMRVPWIGAMSNDFSVASGLEKQGPIPLTLVRRISTA